MVNALTHAWRAFTTPSNSWRRESLGPPSSIRPDRRFMSGFNDRSVVTSIYNQIGVDVAAIDIRHIRVNENGEYQDDIDSGLNECLNVSANIDQTGRAFIQDVAMSLLDEGAVAIVPVDTDVDIRRHAGFDVKSLRCGRIVNWHPRHVRVELYNDRSGRKEEIILPKDRVAIVENPLYDVMNRQNSTLQRLIKKMALLDAVDSKVGAGKLDIIIQLPYTIKNDARREQAESRRKAIESQLEGSQYGIAYADATERITQLNRPAENNLLAQVEYLTKQLYGQLGLAPEIFSGTADEKTMLNYYNRTVEPVISAITDAMNRVFLTKTARSQGQRLMYFRDPFKLVDMTTLSDLADKLSRNEIMSSDEFRAVLGLKPRLTDRSQALMNKNMPYEDSGSYLIEPVEDPTQEENTTKVT